MGRAFFLFFFFLNFDETLRVTDKVRQFSTKKKKIHLSLIIKRKLKKKSKKKKEKRITTEKNPKKILNTLQGGKTRR